MAKSDREQARAPLAALDEAAAGVWAIAALGRLAESGTLSRLAAGDEVLEDPVELADARLLAAYGVLDAGKHGYLAPFGAALTAEAAAALARTQLLQAIAHTRGQPPGWHNGDGAILLAQGRASIHLAQIIEQHLLPRMPEAQAALRAGHAGFLDVGVGVAALSIAIAERFPGTQIVGLDVLPAALEIARTQIAVAEMRGVIELRLESVAELSEREAFDLAWVPQMFSLKTTSTRGYTESGRRSAPGGGSSPRAPEVETGAASMLTTPCSRRRSAAARWVPWRASHCSSDIATRA
jgi:Methyltransferase domain